MEKIRLGISACLVGEKVRYDGSHQHNRFLTQELGRFIEYVPVCPEVEMGLPIPRESLRLIGSVDQPRLVFAKSGQDITAEMTAWAEQRVRRLEQDQLCGFIFKSRSPSSGMARVKLYDQNGVPNKAGVGLFARIFMQHFPLLPVEEDGRLNDPVLRESFIERVFTLKRWRDAMAREKSHRALMTFHARHKLLLMSHSVEIYRQSGKLVGQGQAVEIDELYQRYWTLMMKGLGLKTTVAKHVNVLQHIQGYFKKQLTADEKQELVELIEAYRQRLLPLIVPVTLLNHFVRKYDQPYLQQQWYLNPHPLELQLRNHV